MKFLKYFSKKKEIIYESSLSRVWRMIEEGKYGFGVISAYRDELPNDENKRRHEELKKTIKKKGYGFVELKGRFGGKDEQSLFVPMVNKNLLLTLGKKYDQDSVIYKDDNEFVEIDRNKKVINNFVRAAREKNLTFDKELFKQFFSALLKGSHRGKKFLFTLQEKELFGFNEVAYSRRGEEPQWITIFQDYVE